MDRFKQAKLFKFLPIEEMKELKKFVRLATQKLPYWDLNQWLSVIWQLYSLSH